MYIAALPGISPKDYEIIVQEVLDQYKDQVFVYTRDLLKSLNDQGYFTIAISGSQNDIVQKLADYHGFDYAVGAELEIIKGKYTGIIKTPIFDKGSLLKELVQKFKLSYKDSFGVGDSASDIALLQAVQNPIAFNPNYELYQHSIKQQWTIVVERKNVIYELKNQNGQYYLTGEYE
jgi:HAD superfamily phosphoserine phosphatase-like hydrolase